MKLYKHILRLREKQLSQQEIARVLKISSSTVNKYFHLSDKAELTCDRVESMSNLQIEALLFPDPKEANKLPPIDYEYIRKELKRSAVTLKLLHAELAAENEDIYYSYSTFCRLYRQWAGKKNLTMRQEHKPGERLWVDFAGDTVPIYDRKSDKELFDAQIYCSSTGDSGLLYCEALPNQQIDSFIGAHERNLEYLGGVPHLLIPDNLKSGVTKADNYDPTLNQTYEDFTNHYGIVALPARARRPRDKAKVEQAVLMVEREILAVLRNKKFYSLGELNAAIKPLIEKINNRPYQLKKENRSVIFNKVDKPALLALPASKYDVARFYRRTITLDYHIHHDGHYYSVPHNHVGDKVDIRVSEKMIEIIHRGERIATHPRSYIEGKTTTYSHMPVRHQKYVDWTIEAIHEWAASIGSETAKAMAELINKFGEAKSLRAIAGLKFTSKKHGADKLEKACQLANANKLYDFKFIRQLIKSNVIPITSPSTRFLPKNHENVRGSSYFEGLNDNNKEVHNA